MEPIKIEQSEMRGFFPFDYAQGQNDKQHGMTNNLEMTNTEEE
jgi:hypothetical protein